MLSAVFLIPLIPFCVVFAFSKATELFMYHPQVSASGDQMARLWDVKSGDLLGSFRGHLCSLKSVAFTQQEKGILYI